MRRAPHSTPTQTSTSPCRHKSSGKCISYALWPNSAMQRVGTQLGLEGGLYRELPDQSPPLQTSLLYIQATLAVLGSAYGVPSVSPKTFSAPDIRPSREVDHEIVGYRSRGTRYAGRGLLGTARILHRHQGELLVQTGLQVLRKA